MNVSIHGIGSGTHRLPGRTATEHGAGVLRSPDPEFAIRVPGPALGTRRRRAADEPDRGNPSPVGPDHPGPEAEEAKEASKGTAGGLAGNKAQDMKSGNVNVPGGKAADSLKKESGHGAEKKGAAEQADNTASLFRGRR